MSGERDPIGIGITFRDEIAMRTLPALIKNYCKDVTVSQEQLSKWAYDFADELIKARGGPPPSRYGKKKLATGT